MAQRAKTRAVQQLVPVTECKSLQKHFRATRIASVSIENKLLVVGEGACASACITITPAEGPYNMGMKPNDDIDTQNFESCYLLSFIQYGSEPYFWGVTFFEETDTINVVESISLR